MTSAGQTRIALSREQVKFIGKKIVTNSPLTNNNTESANHVLKHVIEWKLSSTRSTRISSEPLSLVLVIQFNFSVQSLIGARALG